MPRKRACPAFLRFARSQFRPFPMEASPPSKLVSLCRMTTEREMAALRAIDRIEKRESVEYEVIPL